ncbi:MAG: amino acid ABC transporter permease [Lachnospiraceae bacterium]|nr:amino acid ABC transporter permease [Lachnospiraceae bacterium]
MNRSLSDRLYDALIYKDRWHYITNGLEYTIIITVCALIIGLVLGSLSAIVKTAHQNNKKNPGLTVLDFIVSIYLTVIRGTPTVVQLMIMYFIIWQSGTSLEVAIAAFGINSGAYLAEVLRSGIQSVDRGQMEAGRSLGLSYSQTMRKIILPQAFKNVAPAIFNEFITLLKETSVAGYVGIQELTKGGDIIRSITYDAVPPLLIVALIYLIIVIGLTQILRVIERRLALSDLR